MSSIELDFETQYECCACQCGDERLDLEWDEDTMSFIAECSCIKRHQIKPTKCNIEITSE